MGFFNSILGGVGKWFMEEESARRQRAWQDKFYRTRHQWEVDDLRKAGLNPIFSAVSAASVPSGSSGGSPGDLANSAVTAKRVNQEIQESRQRIALSKDQQELLREQTSAAAAAAEKSKVDADIARHNYEAKYKGKYQALIAGEFSDWPKAFAGPARTLVGGLYSIAGRVHDLFRRKKAEANSASQRYKLEKEEKKVMKALEAKKGGYTVDRLGRRSNETREEWLKRRRRERRDSSRKFWK